MVKRAQAAAAHTEMILIIIFEMNFALGRIANAIIETFKDLEII
jgi:hypothetical protein